MRSYSFYAFGHENLLGNHRNTIEFTKDTFLTKDGDCIIGIAADFSIEKLREFLSTCDSKISMEICAAGISDRLTFFPNPNFSSHHEMVIRKTDFFSVRTFGINADKAAKDLNRDMINEMKKKDTKIHVSMHYEKENIKQ